MPSLAGLRCHGDVVVAQAGVEPGGGADAGGRWVPLTVMVSLPEPDQIRMPSAKLPVVAA